MGLFRTDYIPRAELPPRRITPNTIKPDSRQRTHCNKCGAAYVEGKNFCVECGAPKTVFSSLSMGDNRYKAKELAEYLTGWLAENPYLYNIKLSTHLNCISNDFDRVGSVRASNVTLNYAIAQQPYNRHYGVAYVYTYRVTINFSKILNVTSETLVQEWQQLNPDLKVEDWHGGHTTTREQGIYQLYALIVYSKPAPAAAQPQIPQPSHQPAPQVQFCCHCGNKLTPGASFCSACGRKV